MFIEPDQPRPEALKHNPFKALIVPRPIGWITTLDAAGAVNLAPFSFFNAVAESPPCVMYCANGTHREGGAKDSLRNVQQTEEFVCNLVTWDLREAMNQTSANMPHGQDEMAAAGLESLPSHKVRPPRVKAAPAHLECKLLQVVALPEGRNGAGNAIVIGRVVGIHIADEVVADGRVDITRLKPVARLGYMDYAVVAESFEMLRPD